MAQQTTNLELVVYNYIRNQYESKFNRVNVPLPLKYLIVSFSKEIFGSKLLTLKEDMGFVQLLLTKLSNIQRLNLLFTASDSQIGTYKIVKHTNEFTASDFHSKCDNKNGPTVTIIKGKFGNIFGAYTTVSSTSLRQLQLESGYIDKDAFLFLIRSSNELEQKECPKMIVQSSGSLCAYYLSPDYGPIFAESIVSASWIMKCGVLDYEVWRVG